MPGPLFTQLAQVALRNDTTILKALELTVKVKGSLSGFVAQARLFYNAVVQDDELEC